MAPDKLVGPKFKAHSPSEFYYFPAGVVERARETAERLKKWFDKP